jgi:hypothetical protein
MIRNESKFTETGYRKLLDKLLTDTSICTENKKLFKSFFVEQEYKLKTLNSKPQLDAGMCITLVGYMTRLRNVNKWFNNKPLKDITKEDIKRVYDGLEFGKIKSNRGLIIKDRIGYYNKVFKSTLFKMAGNKDLLAKEIIKYNSIQKSDVRFFTEEDFRKFMIGVNKTHHRLLFWLSFDYGENINSLLQLKKKNFTKQKNEDTKESEYKLWLPKELLKRSRQERAELNNYKETYELLELFFKNLNDEDRLFNIGYGTAKQILQYYLSEHSGLKVIPAGDRPTWKDFRSSMACDLLKKGWTREEVNDRLGHKPSSDEIDKYINFLALNKNKPKQKLYHNSLDKLQQDLEESKQREKQEAMRREKLSEQVFDLQKQMSEMASMMAKFNQLKGKFKK